MNKDSGNWLSAQQAVQPDGTVVGNLPLINKKLPPFALSPTEAIQPSISKSWDSQLVAENKEYVLLTSFINDPHDPNKLLAVLKLIAERRDLFPVVDPGESVLEIARRCAGQSN